MPDRPLPESSSVSHLVDRNRFGRESFAAAYPSEYRNTWRDQRELQCILACASLIRTCGNVLDLPCGTGRITRHLVKMGFRLTSADSSDTMLSIARDRYQRYLYDNKGWAPSVTFDRRDVLATGYDTDQFDGVLCIRLLHHFAEAETRRAALREMARICRGQIVVTFLNSFALNHYASALRTWLRRKSPRTSQLPISMRTFAADIDVAGLRIREKMAALWGISSRWFLVLERNDQRSLSS